MTYQISRDGQLYGPYTLEDIRRYLAAGNVLPTDLAHSEDMPSWLPVAQLLNPAPTAPASFPSEAPQLAYAGPFADAREVTGAYTFFPVSPLKFTVMSLCTFGFYHLYWAYQNWSLYHDQVDGEIMPWARAVFAGIWNFPLFSRVHEKAAGHQIPTSWNPIVLGIAVLLFGIVSRAPHAWSALAFLSFLAYLPVVVTIEQINRQQAQAVGLPLNDKFSALNIVGIVLGGLLLLFSLIGIIAAK